MTTQAKFDMVVEAFNDWLAENNTKIATIDGGWWQYADGAWSQLSSTEIEHLETSAWDIAKGLAFDTGKDFKKLWASIEMELRPRKAVAFDASPLIALKSKTYNTVTDDLTPHDADDFTTRKLLVDYKKDAKCTAWLDILERIFQDFPVADRKEIVSFLQEWFGTAIGGGKQWQDTRALRKMLLLHGVSGTGKTTIADVCKAFFSDAYNCASTMDELCRPFGTEALVGKRASIVDDGIGKDTKIDAKLFKRLITGEQISVGRKYKSALNFRFHGPLLWTTNNRPAVADESNALYDRIIVLPINHVFPKEQGKKDFGKYGSAVEFLRAKGEFSGILNWAMDGLDRAMTRGHFEIPRVASEASDAYRQHNDVIYAFLKQCCTYDAKVVNTATAISGAVAAFSTGVYNQKLSVRTAQSELLTTVHEVHPAVKVTKPDVTSRKGAAFVGLKLNEGGISYVKWAQEQQLFAPGMTVETNARAM